jgi:hypothetical protein
MTTRDAYTLAEEVATLTGRDAMTLIRWAARQARSTAPGKIAVELRMAQRRFTTGRGLPLDFPDAVKPAPRVELRSASETQDWM